MSQTSFKGKGEWNRLVEVTVNSNEENFGPILSKNLASGVNIIDYISNLSGKNYTICTVYCITFDHPILHFTPMKYYKIL